MTRETTERTEDNPTNQAEISRFDPLQRTEFRYACPLERLQIATIKETITDPICDAAVERLESMGECIPSSMPCIDKFIGKTHLATSRRAFATSGDCEGILLTITVSAFSYEEKLP